jgi:hypothetical protein
MKKKKSAVKTFIIVAVIIAAIILAGVLVFNAAVSGFNNTAGDHQQILKTSSAQPKLALVVYQPSMSGVTSKMAEQIAKGLNENGYEVMLNNPGAFLTADVSKYSVLVLGSPVYAGKISPVLLEYAKRIQVSTTQKVILFSTGSVTEAPELDELAALLPGAGNVKKVKLIVNNQGVDSQAYDVGKNN